MVSNFKILPLMLVLCYYSGFAQFFYFKQEYSSDITRVLLLSPAYTLSLFFLSTYIETIKKVLSSFIIYLILIMYIFISSFWSYYPNNVFIELVHFSGMFLICIITLNVLNQQSQLLKTILVYSLVVLILNIAFIYMYPSRGIIESGRWQGLFAHPNTLGSFCWVSLWACISQFRDDNFRIKILKYLVIIIACYILIKTNSVTSMFCAVFLTFAAIIKNFMHKSTSIRMLIFFSMCCTIIITILLAYMLDPKIFTMTFLFDFFGRDPNLTGRISLWEIGIEAVRERLVLGWSFDSQRSVMSTQFKIGYGQFHNGYIDLFVAGGLIGFGIFAYMIIIFIKRSMVLNSSTKFSNIAFAVTLLIHNFSEASIIHSVNYLWFVFTLLFVFSSHEYGIIKRERYK